MKLEVGMYVRNSFYGIGKINRLYKDQSGKIWYNVKFKCYEDNENHCGICEQSKGFKASHNIIDLIEVGDYVNGYLVTDVYRPTGDEVFRIEIERDTLKGHIIDNSTQIKTILTKESFENNCYKIGD